MKKVLLSLLAIVSITFISCSGEDGIDGKDGVDGKDGINGTGGTSNIDYKTAILGTWEFHEKYTILRGVKTVIDIEVERKEKLNSSSSVYYQTNSLVFEKDIYKQFETEYMKSNTGVEKREFTNSLLYEINKDRYIAHDIGDAIILKYSIKDDLLTVLFELNDIGQDIEYEYLVFKKKK